MSSKTACVCTLCRIVAKLPLSAHSAELAAKQTVFPTSANHAVLLRKFKNRTDNLKYSKTHKEFILGMNDNNTLFRADSTKQYSGL